MPEHVSLLEELVAAWQYTRQGVIEEAQNLPEASWSARPTPESRDVAELVRHIVEASLLAVGEVTRPDGDFTRQSFEAHLREHAGSVPDRAERSEWLVLLRSTLEHGVGRLRDFGEDAIRRPIRQFNGEPASRLTWFHHHIGHEEYHRGQLALYARLDGRVPALTQRIRGT